MLVLTRKVNEKIRIGDDIEITVVLVDRDTVRLGVSAPRSVQVHRSEVYDEIAAERDAAPATDLPRRKAPIVTPPRPIRRTG